jgi:pyruvate dehydrogenase E1 component alpha subunit
MNLAAIWKLPVLFVCNNNQYAISTPASFSTPVENPGADRAAADGMPSKAVDGLDVLAVYEAAKELVDGIRAGNGPAVLDCRTYRVRGHFEGDQAKYRDVAVTEEWRKKDCVAKMENDLIQQGVMTAEEIQQVRDEVLAKMEAAIAYADASPEPTPEDLFKNLYV